MTLYEIQGAVQRRVDEIASSYGEWPCRKGCDECCRRLASVPVVTAVEWDLITGALRQLPVDAAESARRRIRESASHSRPVVCPLLDLDAGRCMVYEARPVACRTYGFYADRDGVLGCGRIEAITAGPAEVVWGNHAGVERELRSLGDPAALFVRVDSR